MNKQELIIKVLTETLENLTGKKVILKEANNLSTYSFGYKDLPNNKKEFIALNKKTKEEISVAIVRMSVQGYNRTSGEKVTNANKKVYDLVWNKDGVSKLFGHSNTKIGSLKLSKGELDLEHFAELRSVPTVLSMKNLLNTIYHKYNQ